jgi:hypothetical protein
MLIPVIAQGITVIAIELSAVVAGVGGTYAASMLSFIVATKVLLVVQLAATTTVLLTLVATIVIWVPETDTVAESPVEQLLWQE